MPSMDELLAATALPAGAVEHLHRLVARWQLLADLSFADLILFVPRDPETFIAVAQMRPTTGPTAYLDDVVGAVVAATDRPQLSAAVLEERICREGDPVWLEGVPVREEAIPVVADGRVVAVVARDTNLAAARAPSRLEIAYLRSAGELAQMLAAGEWPQPGDPDDVAGPRVGDGLVRVEPDGTVGYASPNALSAYRRLGHLGDLEGARLDEVTDGLVRPSSGAVDEPVTLVTTGKVARLAELEAREAVVQLQAVPLHLRGEWLGAVILVRDVTEVRRRERQLMGKDATIREIHHRVKNNLQTVAALLRLQARRLESPEARSALEESVRRVSSIAVVHETLSGTLDEAAPFDEIADRIIAMVAEVLVPAGARIERTGSFGVLPPDVATPLAMVVTELLQNAAEHGVGTRGEGVVTVDARRSGARLVVDVRDDGPGLPRGFSLGGSHRLGLQIVRTLVENELRGCLSLTDRPGGGAVASVEVEVPPRR